MLAEFALKLGMGSDNPEVWSQIHSDWIQPVVEKAA